MSDRVEAIEGEKEVPDIHTRKGNRPAALAFVAVCALVLIVILVLLLRHGKAEESDTTKKSTTTGIEQKQRTISPGLHKTFTFGESKEVKQAQQEVQQKQAQEKQQAEQKPPAPAAPPAPPRTVWVPPPPQIDPSAFPMSHSQGNGPGNGGLASALTAQQAAYQVGDSLRKDLARMNDKTQPVGAELKSLSKTSPVVRVSASTLPDQDYLITRGTYIDCVLNTKMVSTVPGMTTCTVTRNLYSQNGSRLLIERGSQVTGEYSSKIKQGQARMFVLWDRLRTPEGVVVDLASPGTDPLGAGGASGYVDNHFWQRFGGAMLLSIVDDAAYYAASQGSGTNYAQNSSETAQNMATEALKNTINIPPTFYKNQGERIGILVARDLDFSSVLSKGTYG
nr:type IV secretion system protein VirB10 [Dongshaea marina]